MDMYTKREDIAGAALKDLQEYVGEARISSRSLEVIRDVGLLPGKSLKHYAGLVTGTRFEAVNHLSLGKVLSALGSDTEKEEGGLKLVRETPPGKYPAEWVIKEANQEAVLDGE